MSEIHMYEPLWGSWYVESMIGEGASGRVYRVWKKEYGKVYYSAVKFICVTDNAIMNDICQELDLMSRLRGNSNIVSFEDLSVIPVQGAHAYDVMIRMEMLTPLQKYLKVSDFSEKSAVGLGIDICKALELCEELGIVHRDIKPDNIFISELGCYKLGDFGIAIRQGYNMSEQKKKGTLTYMAPEVYHGSEYGITADIYSLGIVLYRLLSQGRIPFLNRPANESTAAEREVAFVRRMRGEMISPIAGVTDILNQIIIRACAYNPNQRFASPNEMRAALEEYYFDADSKVEQRYAVLQNVSAHQYKTVSAAYDSEMTYTGTFPLINSAESRKAAKTADVDCLRQGNASIYNKAAHVNCFAPQAQLSGQGVMGASQPHYSPRESDHERVNTVHPAPILRISPEEKRKSAAGRVLLVTAITVISIFVITLLGLYYYSTQI